MKIRGRVVDTDGRPVGGARLSFITGNTAIANLAAGEDGSFGFSNAVDCPGDQLDVTVGKPGYLPYRATVKLEQDQPSDVLVHLQPVTPSSPETDPTESRPSRRTHQPIYRALFISILATVLIAGGTWAFRAVYYGRAWTMRRIMSIKSDPSGAPGQAMVQIYRSGLRFDIRKVDMSRLMDHVWQRQCELRAYRDAKTPERQERQREMIALLNEEILKTLVAGGVPADEARNLSHESVLSIMKYGGYEKD